ncbi:GNAT family N-acetyltransferase [Streptomyces sp. NPDC092296]|uniref:GNAT family N-acetyltransferase n=1 Tax=Streptomyces sp. NPDC092296 TaxID=3366012 RepID=UPI00382B7FE3
MTGPYEIRVAATAAELEQVHGVRREVFIVEQQIPEDEEWDDLDPVCVQLLATGPGGVPLGTGRLVHGEAARKVAGRDGTVLLGRLAVLPAARGTGLGAALVRAIERAGAERGGREMELHAQVHAIGFYQRLGYAAHGPEYLDAGIPHRTMTRPLTD